MFVKLLRFFSGYVRFAAEGGFPERFLSDAAAMGLQITDTVRKGECFSAACPAGEYRRLRPLAKRAALRLRIIQKHGVYFRLFPYRKRIGLPVGLLLGAVLLYVLSGRIWVVTVDTEVPVDQSSVLAAVAENGVYVGCKIDAVDMQALRIEALSKLENLVYVSVNPSGCVARVTVNTRAPTPTVEDFHKGYSNLVASRDGRIIKTDVYSGWRAVQVGDGVTAGMLLVSGTMESNAGNLYLRRAAGKIIAETTRVVTVSAPFEEIQYLPAGDAVYRPYLRFLRWDIPLFADTPLVGRYTANTYYRLLGNGDFALPFGVIDTHYIPLKETAVTYTKEQTAAKATLQLQNAVAALAESGVAVKAEQARSVTVTDTAYTITVTLQCEEDIAREIPLFTE